MKQVCTVFIVLFGINGISSHGATSELPASQSVQPQDGRQTTPQEKESLSNRKGGTPWRPRDQMLLEYIGLPPQDRVKRWEKGTNLGGLTQRDLDNALIARGQ